MRNCCLFFFIIGSFISQSLSALPAQIVIIRHAEKNTNNHELSIKGKERAAALVPFLLDTPELKTFKTPAEIYASIPPKPETSQRSIDTVKPLADFLKLTIRDKYESNDYKRMIEEIKKDPDLTGKMVLICWEHNYIPEIARGFGAFQTPGTWSTSVFDRVWIINLQPSGKASFQNLPQRLLYGDSSN